MEDLRPGLVTGAPAGPTHAPRDVEILGVHPLHRVKATDLVPGGPASEQDGGHCPVDGASARRIPVALDAHLVSERSAQVVQAHVEEQRQPERREGVHGVLGRAIGKLDSRRQQRQVGAVFGGVEEALNRAGPDLDVLVCGR